MTRRIPFIDFAKGFSIFAIVIFHYCLPLNYGESFRLAISFGGTGIHLFFLLSGLGLGLSRSLSVTEFYKRRFIKILLPYYFFITAVFLINLGIPIYPAADFHTWLSHIFFYKMFVEEYIGSFGFHLWFMSTIIQFYLIFPLIIWLYDKLGTRLLLISALVISITYISLIVSLNLGSIRVWNSFFLTYFWEFILGFLIAKNPDIISSFRLKIWQYLLIFIICVTMMWVLMTFFGQTGKLFNDFAGLFAFTTFTAMVYKLATMKEFSFIKLIFNGINKISFELYLVHYLSFSLLIFYLHKYEMDYNIFYVPVLLILSLILSLGFQKLMNRVNQWI